MKIFPWQFLKRSKKQQHQSTLELVKCNKKWGRHLGQFHRLQTSTFVEDELLFSHCRVPWNLRDSKLCPGHPAQHRNCLLYPRKHILFINHCNVNPKQPLFVWFFFNKHLLGGNFTVFQSMKKWLRILKLKNEVYLSVKFLVLQT